ncbi:MAG: hypothetical protein WD046_01050 [Paracoccaceae bacterium]
MRFALFLLALLAVIGFAMGFPTRVGISGHEGDLFHMIDAGLRMRNGEIPHLDFMTPLGILSIAPMAMFLSLGFAGGKAALLSNLLVALLIAPAVWWVGQTRMQGWLRMVFGAAMLILAAALIYGGGAAATSLSMFYNRWAWAIVFIMLVGIMWPAPEGERARSLGLLVGIGLSLLALTKMTFFVAFAPPITIILLAQGRVSVAGIAALIGVTVFAITTVILGFAFWQAYAQDLLQVALHSQRTQPGENLISTLSSPKFIAGSVALVGAIIWLRKTGQQKLGLYLLLLAPAFVVTTWQNWGNDPKWLFFVALLVLANLPALPRAREQGFVLATIACVAIAPTMMTMTMSLSRSVFVDWAAFGRIVDEGPISDILLRKERLAESDIVQPAPGLSDGEPLREFNGVTVPDCRLNDGLVRLAVAYAQAVVAHTGDKDAGVFLADLVNIMPLISDLRVLRGGAPWYYGADPGFDDADYVVLPKCPLSVDAREKAMDALEASGLQLELVEETPLMFLFAVNRPQ